MRVKCACPDSEGSSTDLSKNITFIQKTLTEAVFDTFLHSNLCV